MSYRVLISDIDEYNEDAERPELAFLCLAWEREEPL